MPSKIAVVILAATLLASGSTAGDTAIPSIVFVGDILLARAVDREIQAKKTSPWVNITGTLQAATHLIGNFEGAVGTPDQCENTSNHSACFAVRQEHLRFMAQTGFTALGIENNHSADLGADGKRASRKTLAEHGIRTLTFKDSPWFFTLGQHVVGVIAYNEIAAGASEVILVPDVKLGQKIKLARQLANMVVVYVHWGNELQDWPSEEQRKHAHWLVGQGADMVIGHHPHVTQGQECIDGRPVVYSLGNHVFDQKYPMTKTGHALKCTFETANPSCRFLQTLTPAHTSFPASILEDAAADKFWRSCQPKMRPFPILAGTTIRPHPGTSLSSLENAKLEFRNANSTFSLLAPGLLHLTPVQFGDQEQDKLLLTLEMHYSSLDKETAPRPYVYSIGNRGLNAKWRGSALAWPLLDITVVREDGIDYLCALHRGDSFLIPDPKTPARRVLVYRWNNFGFSAFDSKRLNAECEYSFRSFLPDVAEQGTQGGQ